MSSRCVAARDEGKAGYGLRGATETAAAPRGEVAGTAGATGAGAFLGFFGSLLPR